MDRSLRPTLNWIARATLAALAALATSAAPALAYDAKESDAFYLGTGSANIQVRGSEDLIAGDSTFGGIRIGLFWTVFIELGYGALNYADKVQVKGVEKEIEFRTTGAHGGLGFLIPIRKISLGAKYVVNPDNKWEQRQIDVLTDTKDFSDSGTINYESYYGFVKLGDWFEIGVRRDHISDTDSLLTNSFGPYFALNVPIR